MLHLQADDFFQWKLEKITKRETGRALRTQEERKKVEYYHQTSTQRQE